MNKKLLEPIIPRGFQDSYGEALLLEKELIRIIEENFLRYGYSEIKTTPFEFSENIGSFLSDDLNNPMSDIFTFNDKDKKLSLIYDLSAPLSRFVSAQYLKLAFPYKRFQIQRVFRNETSKTGRGRYRSFLQGDFDQIFIGNVPPQANSEICQIIGDTLSRCKIQKDQFKINIFNRKIVEGLLNDLKISDKVQRFKVLRALDKYDRITENFSDLLKKERVDPESGDKIIGANLSDEQISVILNFLKIKDLDNLKSNFKNNLQKEGIQELEKILEILSYGDYLDQIKIDPSIARGLNYYDSFCVETTVNFKVKNNQKKLVELGSIASGGSYATLCGRFKGGNNFQGTGCSFGISRLVFLSMQLNQLKISQKLPVIVCPMDNKYLSYAYAIAKILREKNINTEIYSDPGKNLGKQLTYANKKSSPIAAICGQNEFENNTVTLKNLLAKKGEDNQITIPRKDLINEIRKIIPKNN